MKQSLIQIFVHLEKLLRFKWTEIDRFSFICRLISLLFLGCHGDGSGNHLKTINLHSEGLLLKF